MCWVNLPDYEVLLEEYREEYRKRCPDDYLKLFSKGEPDWGLGTGKAEPRLAQSVPVETDMAGETVSLLAQMEQAFRNRQATIAGLTAENRKLQADNVALQASLRKVRDSHYRKIVDEELRQDCENLLENKAYAEAIWKASVLSEVRLRQAVGGNGQERFKEGVELVDYVLAPNTGKLVIYDHPGEQDGVRMLFKGAVQSVRNPPAHRKVPYSDFEAWHIISLIDYLLSLLAQARPKTGR